MVLESIVTRVFSCDCGGMGSYIDAYHFESAPFDADLIALAPLREKADCHEIEDFLINWKHCFVKKMMKLLTLVCILMN